VNSSKLFKIQVICLDIAFSLLDKISSLKKTLSESFQPGSQIIPVAQPVKAVYLFHLLIM
jgi:hypothetical protein